MFTGLATKFAQILTFHPWLYQRYCLDPFSINGSKKCVVCVVVETIKVIEVCLGSINHNLCTFAMVNQIPPKKTNKLEFQFVTKLLLNVWDCYISLFMSDLRGGILFSSFFDVFSECVSFKWTSVMCCCGKRLNIAKSYLRPQHIPQSLKLIKNFDTVWSNVYCCLVQNKTPGVNMDAFRTVLFFVYFFFCSESIHYWFWITFLGYFSMPPALHLGFSNPLGLISPLTTLLLLTFTLSSL